MGWDLSTKYTKTERAQSGEKTKCDLGTIEKQIGGNPGTCSSHFVLPALFGFLRVLRVLVVPSSDIIGVHRRSSVVSFFLPSCSSRRGGRSRRRRMCCCSG